MKTIIITTPEHFAVSLWRTDTPESVALGDDDPIAGISLRPGMFSWDWRGRSGAKVFGFDFDA